MDDTPSNLSRGMRWTLVVGLWVMLLVIIALVVRNIGWVQSWASGIFFGCILFVILLLTFSLLAAAIHLSIDAIKGRYPYPERDSRPAKERLAWMQATHGGREFAAQRATRSSELARSQAIATHRDRGPRYKAALNVLGVAAVTLVMTLVLLEIGLRLFAPQTSPEMRTQLWNSLFTPDSATIYRNRPGVDVTFRLDESTTDWSINSQGLREDHLVGPPPTDTVRILDIGDSFTFGYGVEENEAFPDLLNGGSVSDGKRVESINAGVSGYGTDNEAAWLQTYGWVYQPKIVLMGFFVGNDVLDVLNNNNRIYMDSEGALAIVPSNAPPEWEVHAPVPDNPVAQGKAWLASNSHAYVFLRATLHSITDPFSKPVVRDVNQFDTAPIYYKNIPANIEDGWGRVTKLLDFINKAAQAHGAKLVVVVIPAREQVEDAYWNDMKAGFRLTNDSLERDKPQTELEAWGASSNVPLIDLLPGFRAAQGGPYYFRKDPHWNATGQKLAADLIKDGLAKLGLANP